MNKSFLLLVAAFLAACLTVGCQPEQRKGSPALEAIVQSINSKPDQKLGNGSVLTSCDYSMGDSLLTYNVTFSDSRFDKLTDDSIKSLFRIDLEKSGHKVLIDVLKENSIGIQYVCSLPGGVDTVMFAPVEIKTINN